jgi:hypothetical protein
MRCAICNKDISLPLSGQMVSFYEENGSRGEFVATHVKCAWDSPTLLVAEARCLESESTDTECQCEVCTYFRAQKESKVQDKGKEKRVKAKWQLSNGQWSRDLSCGLRVQVDNQTKVASLQVISKRTEKFLSSAVLTLAEQLPPGGLSMELAVAALDLTEE